MYAAQINQALSAGAIDQPGIFPHVENLGHMPFIFNMEFGLDTLPDQPGLILIRGARQYGKSTWLELKLKETIEQFGAGSAFYLNGDELRDRHALIEAIQELLPLYGPTAGVRRLFIDEITAVENWQKALKILADQGNLRTLLVVTTGSKASDLRHGTERLPGRKGKLDRTTYHFLPVSYKEFKRVCGSRLGQNTLPAYMLSGGSPVACSELASHGRIPEYVIEMTRDWIYGEVVSSGRNRSSLIGVMEGLHRFGGTPVGQAKLAREAGLANNTVAAGYIETLMNLLSVGTAYAWDTAKHRPNKRKPGKFHFINLLVATAWHPAGIRSVDDYRSLPAEEQAKLIEWQVATECWRRAALRGEEFPELTSFWASKEHEIDFVTDKNTFIEVKRGKRSPLEFKWFSKVFPHDRLIVVNQTSFETEQIQGVTLERFLNEIS